MSQPVLIKIYANLYPVAESLACAVTKVAGQCMPSDGVTISLKNDLMTLAFEGIWYPLQETLEIINKHLTNSQHGKLDFIDIESWKMTRYLFCDGAMSSSSAPLNNVLSFSGH